VRREERSEGLASESLRRLRDYWLGRRGRRRMPARKDIDPLDIPKLLPKLVLTDVLHEPLRLRYRLIGTFVTDLAGRNATGRWLDEALYGERTDDMLWAYRRCVADRAPVAVREQVQFVAKDWLTIEALLLPCGEADDRPDLVLSGVDRVEPPAKSPPNGESYILDWARDAAGGDPPAG